MNKLIYLASPYSHRDPKVREQRFQAVCKATAYLMLWSMDRFLSPIAHSHPIAVYGNLMTGWEQWARLDKMLLERCDELVVLKLEGWDKSEGILAEVKYARELGKPISYIDPSTLMDNEGVTTHVST